MDEFKQDTLEPEWITSRNRIEAHEDIILRNPRFSTIERFLISGGGGAFDMYNRMMELMYRKDTKIAVNIMNDFKNKSTNNLKAVRAIDNLNGLFGLMTAFGTNLTKARVT